MRPHILKDMVAVTKTSQEGLSPAAMSLTKSDQATANFAPALREALALYMGAVDSTPCHQSASSADSAPSTAPPADEAGPQRPFSTVKSEGLGEDQIEVVSLPPVEPTGMPKGESLPDFVSDGETFLTEEGGTNRALSPQNPEQHEGGRSVNQILPSGAPADLKKPLAHFTGWQTEPEPRSNIATVNPRSQYFVSAQEEGIPADITAGSGSPKFFAAMAGAPGPAAKSGPAPGTQINGKQVALEKDVSEFLSGSVMDRRLAWEGSGHPTHLLVRDNAAPASNYVKGPGPDVVVTNKDVSAKTQPNVVANGGKNTAPPKSEALVPNAAPAAVAEKTASVKSSVEYGAAAYRPAGARQIPNSPATNANTTGGGSNDSTANLHDHSNYLSAANSRNLRFAERLSALEQGAGPAGNAQPVQPVSTPTETVSHAEPPAPPAPRAAEIIDQIANSARFDVAAGKREISLQLDPPELGRVHISVSSDKGILHTHVEVTSSTARELLETNLSHLRTALHKAQLNIGDCTVSLGANDDNGGVPHDARHMFSGGHRSHSRQAGTGARMEIDAPQPRRLAASVTTSLDYFA